MTNKQPITVIELRRLLHEIKDRRPDIGVRFRLIGEMWQTRYMLVFQITEKGVAMRDELSNKLTIFPDLSQVMQFEVDEPFRDYEPHFHYSVDPVLVKY